ncbi:hypothetical protein [Marivita sp. S2033]|uniref:hypothetical protein n=1 Tax=Marivita sp. S2033 TaxID=3373187 RepID=UPI0039829DE6
MTPDLALTLSFDGISLLHRVPGGWARVGDVALDADDLRAALADLRTEADALSSTGGKVMLVVPNEQIKYLSLPDAGQDADRLQDDIRAALDGATPYAVEDLSFDWSRSDGQIHVAAVANETLDEAEAFAKSHHFEPVSFVAAAPDGAFSGEVFFGAAASWTGSAPSRADSAITIVATPLPTANDVTDQTVTDAGSEDTADKDSAKDDQSDATEALKPGAAKDTPNADETDHTPAADATPLAVAQPDATPAPAFTSIRASRGDVPPQPASKPAPRVPTAPSAAPPSKLGSARGTGKGTGTGKADVTGPVLQVETADDPAPRKGFGFFTRRATKEPAATPAKAQTGPSKPGAAPQPAKPPHDPGPARAAVARIAAMRAGRDPDATPDAQTATPNERQRMTVFGARTEPQIGGKPRFLGLMLTAALLVFLLAVAAWASVFLDEGISRFFNRDDATPSIARMPDVEFEPIDGSVTAPPDTESDVEMAALDTGDVNTPEADGLSDLLPPPAALTPEEADARYAATGIWQRAPAAPAPPALTTLDDLYVASIDKSVQQFDAIALPGAQALRNDEAYLSLPNPALPGTRYDLDERGLVIATPEGALNPEGVRIFAGLPPVVPPARPQAPEIVPELDTDAVIADAVLQGFRPRPRPGGLVEGNERAQLAGNTRAELAALRPSARPETLKAQEEEAQPEATRFAVAQSSAPVTRPRNFAAIVERARKAEESRPAQVTQAAAVAPRAVQPKIPSSANVARQATISNAMNMRRINLIGVYGKPANRRALVRLSNGRYQKVKVGDRLDGGQVAAIGNSELRYVKRGKNVVLDMPGG